MDEETDVLPVIRSTFALTNHHLIEAHPTSLCYLNKVLFNKRCHSDAWLQTAMKQGWSYFQIIDLGVILKMRLLICILLGDKPPDI